MLDRIKSFLFGGDAQQGGRDANDTAFAAAALMIEAAASDEGVAPGERARIATLLERRFALTPGASRDMVAAAERRMAETHQLHPFARTIRDGFSEAERVELIEMLWEVIYVDDKADDYEANLMRRLGELIYVRDVDIGAARKRVLDRQASRASTQ